jgi:hypothetical protein
MRTYYARHGISATDGGFEHTFAVRKVILLLSLLSEKMTVLSPLE